MIEQSQPRPTPEANATRSGAQTTGSISRLGDGAAHLSGPSDPPAPVKKPPKKQQAAPKTAPQPGARVAQAKAPPQQPRILVIVPPPPPPSPGLFGSIGNFFGF
jgi:hypothetical protein